MYENPSGPLSTSTTAAAPQALRRPWKGTAVLNTVKVDLATFPKVMFMGSAKRKAFTAERMPDSAKPQKQNAAGVPVWSVKVAVENWRGQTDLMNVTVPMHDDPASKFTTGQLVEFGGLVFGVAPKRERRPERYAELNGEEMLPGEVGYVTWFSADSINAA